MTDRHLSRCTVVAALGVAGGVTLPAWPDQAWAAPHAARATPDGPVLETHPATEPSGTHVRDIGGTNVVFQYGAVLPGFDGWRTREPTREYLSLDRRWRFRFDPRDRGLAEDGTPRTSTTADGASSTSPRPGTCWTRPASARRPPSSARARRGRVGACVVMRAAPTVCPQAVRAGAAATAVPAAAAHRKKDRRAGLEVSNVCPLLCA